MRLSQLRTFRPWRNTRRVINTAWIFTRSGVKCLRTIRRARCESGVSMSADERYALVGRELCLVFARLGPVYVKLGQILSTRGDLVPTALAQALAPLRDNVPPLPLAETLSLIESELGSPLEALFTEFEKEPIAAASLAQVHGARLACSGEPVAVKVQRPGVRDLIDTDLSIVKFLLPWFERYFEEVRRFNVRSVVDEFHKTILMEMDFHREAQNILKFGEIFADVPVVRIPALHNHLCTGRVLVMERLDGIRIDELDALKEAGYDLELLSRHVVSAMAHQIFTHAIFNADMHPGNIVVMPGNTLGLFDFGMVRVIDPETRQLLIDAVLAVLAKDAARVARVLARYAEPGCQVDLRRLTSELHELIVFYYDQTLQGVRMEVLFEEGTNLLSSHKLVIPQQVIMLARTAAITESLVRMLSPSINFVHEFAPFIKEAIRTQITLANLGDGLKRFAVSGMSAIKALPGALNNVLENLGSGDFTVECRHRDLAEHSDKVSGAARQLTVGVIAGSLFLGSALILSRAPHGGSTVAHALATWGMVFATILFAGLLFSIARTK